MVMHWRFEDNTRSFSLNAGNERRECLESGSGEAERTGTCLLASVPDQTRTAAHPQQRLSEFLYPLPAIRGILFYPSPPSHPQYNDTFLPDKGPDSFSAQ